MKKLFIIIIALLCSNVFAKDNFKIVLAQPPGGLNDIFLRNIQKQVNENAALNLNVIIVNKPGGDGIVAINETIQDKSEYVLFFGGSSFIYKAAENEELAKIAKNMTPIIQTMVTPQVFLVDKDSKFKTWQDLVHYSKTNYVNIGTNSIIATKVVQELLPEGKMNIIPFAGDAPVLLNIRNKSLDVGITTYFTAISQITSKDLVGLANTHENDHNLQHVNSIHGNIALGFFAPPSMGAEKVKRMHGIILEAMKSKDIKDMFSNKGVYLSKNYTQENFIKTIEKISKK